VAPGLREVEKFARRELVSHEGHQTFVWIPGRDVPTLADQDLDGMLHPQQVWKMKGSC
jgi:hypothetical protein